LLDLVSVSLDLHSILGWRIACGNRTRPSLHLDNTQPAGANGLQAGIVAQRGNIDGSQLEGIENRAAAWQFNAFPVDVYLKHSPNSSA
jgi:hypothetical protein